MKSFTEILLNDNDNQVIVIDNNRNYKVVLGDIHIHSLKSNIKFIINNSDIKSDIAFKISPDENSDIDIMIELEINKGATNSLINLDMHALILNKNTKVTFSPILKIHELSAIANHKSSIGKIDENIVDYFASRGLPTLLTKEIVRKAYLEF